MSKRLCKCGCGKEVTSKNPKVVFISGHNMKGCKMSKECIEKRKITSMIRYGTDNPSKNKEIINKIKTVLINKNIEDPQRQERINEKRRKTVNEIYGVDFVTQIEDVKNKIKETSLTRYGVTNILASKEFREIIKQKNLVKYGVEYTAQLESVKQKCREKWLKHYGVDNPSKCKKILEKIKKKNLELFGVEWSQQNPEIKKKSIKTCLERYGVDNVFKYPQFQEKFRETFLSTYGVDNPTKCTDILKKSTLWIREYAWEKLSCRTDWIPLFNKNEFLKNGWLDYNTREHHYYDFKCSKCGNIEKLDGSYFPTCCKCFPNNGRSSQEIEVENYIKTLCDSVISSDKSVLENKKELDIFIPQCNLAFEYDGLYWHSLPNQNDKNYHFDKTNLCLKKNIQLIHIFEDEWCKKKDIVKSMIKNLLNVPMTNILGVNDLHIDIVYDSTYCEFLNENHIKGMIYGEFPIGLFNSDNELVSLMLFGKDNTNDDYYQLYRYCNKIDTDIKGSELILFDYFIENFLPQKISCYLDRRWYNDSLMKLLSFQFIKNTSPNYWYVKGMNRENRIKYRKSELPKLLKYFDPNQSEQQNMINNGYNIIYDCGSMLFEWTNPNY